MVSNVTSSTFSQTYRDDFADSDNYYRILFNGGRALQARELTQLQTMIQREAEQHARFVFKEGAAVHSGGVQINTRFEFAKLNTTTYTLPVGYSSLIGETFTGLTSTIQVRIVAIEPAAGSDPATVFIEYVDNNSTSGTTSPIRLTPGEIINGNTSGTNLQIQSTNTTANPAVGRGTRLSVKESVFFVNGHFVFTPAQSIIVSKYSSTPTANAGFTVSEQIVTASDNTALYDNSNDTPNLTAPGADRYKITLTLTLESDVSAGTTFIPAYVVQDGKLAAAKKPGDESLAIIGDIAARRTFEESGNYTVKPFIMKTVDNDSDATKLDIMINPGIAYVRGYRYETTSPIRIPIDRPRTTTTINNDVVAAEYGNYVVCDTLLGLPTFDTLATVNLRSAITYGGSTIGTARVRAVEKFGAQYRLYLFDVTMTGANVFSAVRSIGTSTVNYADLVLENSVAVLKDTANNNLLFDLSNVRPSALSDISLTTQRRFTGTTTGTGTIQFNLSAPGETFANSANWILMTDSSGNEETINITAGGNGTASVTLGTLPTSSAVTMAGYVNKGSATVKTKTLTNRTATIAPEGDNSVQLERADIYRINEIRDGSASGNVITNYYILDNGQRDNFYAEGVLYLKSGFSAPAGNVYVDFDYFEHGASGDFFAVNSYTGQVDYADIPSHRQKNGEIIPLRNVLDFRPRKANTAGDFTSTGAVRMEIPANTDLITADVAYYLGQAYRIVIAQDGSFRAIAGDRSFYPIYPSVPENSMELYRLAVNPYTLSDSDVSLTYVDNRRYTMRDIADLETRMDKIEEITTLNMLELETATLEVLDSSGNNRLKVGLTADNFTDHSQSNRRSIEYRATTDAFNRELRPSFVTRSSELVYDSDNSEYVSLIGDTVYPLYDEVTYTSNNAASEATPVNNFNLGVVVGNIISSPSSDTWYSTDRKPAKIIDGGVDIDPNNGSLWNDWGFNWSGVKESQLKNNYSDTKTKKEGRTTTTVTSTVKKSEVVATSMGDTLLYETSIQYQRERFIFFKAQGLRPNTRYFPFYDGVSVADWVQTGSGKFTRFATLGTDSVYLDPGDRYKNVTSFPAALGGKTSAIYSDANGDIEGIFFVPNKDNIKFLTGVRQFILIDISVLDRSAATSYASMEFVSQGTMKTYQEQIKHTRRYIVDTKVETSVTPGYSSNHGGGGDTGTGPQNFYSPDGTWIGSGYSPSTATKAYGKTWTEEFKTADRQGQIQGSSNYTGGGGGGGAEPKVICAALYSLGMLPEDIYRLDEQFGTIVNREDPMLGDGYRLWATPVAEYIKGNTIGSKIARSIVAPLAQAWAQEMAHVMQPEDYKGNLFGKLLMMVGHPICRTIGKLFLKKQEVH
jgi:hypothetical protein